MLVKCQRIAFVAIVAATVVLGGSCGNKQPSTPANVMQEVFFWSDGQLCELIVLQHPRKQFRHIVAQGESVIGNEYGNFELAGERLVCTPFTRWINSKNSTLLAQAERFDWNDLWLYRSPRHYHFIKQVPFYQHELRIVPITNGIGLDFESNATNWTAFARLYKFK